MNVYLFAAMLPAAILLGCSPQSAISASVCEIASNPAKFAGEAVKVSAHVESDGMEWILIKDDRCETEGINLDYSNEAARSKNAEAIKKAVFRDGPMATDYKDISATFVGTFRWNSASSDRHEIMRFVADSVENLKVVQRKSKRVSPFKELR